MTCPICRADLCPVHRDGEHVGNTCPRCGQEYWYGDHGPPPAGVVLAQALPHVDAVLHGLDLAIAELRRVLG